MISIMKRRSFNGSSVFGVIFFVILIPLALGIILPAYKNHYKVTHGIINYDSTMRKFVYKVNLSSEDIINSLKIMNVKDELSCAFDFKRSVINFEEYGLTENIIFRFRNVMDFRF